MPTLRLGDEIWIPIQQQDLYTLLYDSFFYIEERLMVKKKNIDDAWKYCNCVTFMFDEIRYELNGVKIDCNEHCNYSTKNYTSITYNKALIALNAEWNSRSDTKKGF